MDIGWIGKRKRLGGLERVGGGHEPGEGTKDPPKQSTIGSIADPSTDPTIDPSIHIGKYV